MCILCLSSVHIRHKYHKSSTPREKLLYTSVFSRSSEVYQRRNLCVNMQLQRPGPCTHSVCSPTSARPLSTQKSFLLHRAWRGKKVQGAYIMQSLLCHFSLYWGLLCDSSVNTGLGQRFAVQASTVRAQMAFSTYSFTLGAHTTSVYKIPS